MTCFADGRTIAGDLRNDARPGLTLGAYPPILPIGLVQPDMIAPGADVKLDKQQGATGRAVADIR